MEREATIDVQGPVRPDVLNGEAHRTEFLQLSLSSELLPHVQMRLGRLLDGRLRVVDPFTLILSSTEGHFLAEAPEVGEVGVGQTQSEALRDLQATLGELYFTLAENQSRLVPDLQEIWVALQRKIQPRA